MRQPQPIQVLLVADGQTGSRRLIQMLRACDGRKFRLRRVRRLSEAQRLLQSVSVDVTLLDLWPPDAHGLEVVRETLRIAPGIPLILLSSRVDDSLAAAALQEGAQDFLIKPELTDSQLARSVCHAIARQCLQVSLRSLSLNDELTGPYNRRGFIALAESRQKLAARQGIRSSLIFGDVDDLKHINDAFGHREGDRALQEVADVLRECFRESDIIARIGGDEFCALLTDASESSEALMRERLRRALEARNSRRKRPYQLSVSMGIARITVPYGLEYQLARADAQMYQQKRRKQKRDDAARVLDIRTANQIA